MSDVAKTRVGEFCAELALHYSDRRERDAIWADSMVKALAGFSAEILRAAAQQIIHTRKYRDFPLPAECIDACRKAKDRLDTAERAAKLPAMREHRVGGGFLNTRLANELIVGPMGRQAAKEGWILSLHDFISKHSRLPKDGEIGYLKQASRDFDSAYAECVRGGWPHAHGLEALGASMRKRRDELGERLR